MVILRLAGLPSHRRRPLSSNVRPHMESAVDLLAAVTLFPGRVSGKTTGYASGVRPNHVFPGQPSSIVGVIWFEGHGKAELGSTTRARVRLLYPDSLPPLYPGVTWRIQEGESHIGNACVLSLLPNGS